MQNILSENLFVNNVVKGEVLYGDMEIDTKNWWVSKYNYSEKFREKLCLPEKIKIHDATFFQAPLPCAHQVWMNELRQNDILCHKEPL